MRKPSWAIYMSNLMGNSGNANAGGNTMSHPSTVGICGNQTKLLTCCICIHSHFRMQIVSICANFLNVHVFAYVHINYIWCACVRAKLLQSCPTLCDPMNCSPWGSSVHGIFQARILEWVAAALHQGIFLIRDQIWVSYVSCIGRFFTTRATWESHLWGTSPKYSF